MHALTEMTRQLRAGRGKKGLVLCNGGVLSYQYVVVLGTEPRGSSYPVDDALPELVTDVEVPELAVGVEGECVVEVSFCGLNWWRNVLILHRRTPWSLIVMGVRCEGMLLDG